MKWYITFKDCFSGKAYKVRCMNETSAVDMARRHGYIGAKDVYIVGEDNGSVTVRKAVKPTWTI